MTLSEDESHYVSRVVRARAGDRLSATDGRGALATLVVTRLGRGVTAEVESFDRAERERRAWVWCGAPEGQRADWLVEKLAELGVEEGQPLESDRGEWGAPRGRIERWRRLAIAAMRQSRRRFLLELREPISLDQAIERIPENARLWLTTPGGTRDPAPAPEATLSLAAIGPAAGFTETEHARLSGEGFQPISLSDGRLRTETAAIAWASWWSSRAPARS